MISRCVCWAALCLSLVGCRGGADDEPEAERVTLEKPKPRVESIPGVDLEGLEGPSREAYLEVINDVLSPCGEPISLARCAAEKTGCRACVPAARYLARLAGKGMSSQDLRVHHLLRYGEDTEVSLDVDGAPVKGALMAPVTIVEFSDFQCPSCRHAAPELAKVVGELGGRAKLAFMHFPLPQHTYAEKAARASIAAQRQGKFWEYHDKIFENQHRLGDASFERFARELGLDLEKFREDFASDDVRARVASDREQGVKAGVQGTPSIYVNGREYSGALEDLVFYVEEELDG